MVKKNGCKNVLICEYWYAMNDDVAEQIDCKHYARESKQSLPWCMYHKEGDGYQYCTNKKAQREAMKPKTRWTKKPAKKEGWYWIKTPDGKKFTANTTGSAINCDVEECLRRGFKRSVKPIEEE